MRHNYDLRIKAYTQQLELRSPLYSRFRRLQRMVYLNYKVVILLGQLSM